jgi:hopanoid biosynthesis associated RND transporter like protein HpnN
LITIAAAFASTGLSVNTSTEEILAEDLPFRQVDRAYRTAFPREELAVVVVDAPTSDEAQAAAADLTARLQSRTDLFQRAELAGSSDYFERYGLLFLSADEIRQLGDQLREARLTLYDLASDPTLRGLAAFIAEAESAAAGGAAPATLANLLSQLAATAEARAEGRPAEMAWNTLFDVGEDARGTRRLVQAKPVLDNTSLDRAGPALDALQADIAAVRAEHPAVQMRVTGDPVLRQQELNDAFSGALYASGLSFVLVSLSLILGIRSGRLIAALLITLVIGSIWTTGLAALSVGRLNLISVAFMVLFFGLGVDFGTHLGLRHLEEARKGVPFQEALRLAMVGEGPGIGLSALCAALAFLSFVPTSYVGLAEFGIISALGMLVAVVVTFTVQPALMALMPPKSRPVTGMDVGIGRWIKRNYRTILVVAALVTVAAAFGAVRARLDTNTLNLQDPNTEPVQTYRDLAHDPETSPYGLNVLAPNLDAAREVAARLSAVPGVAGVRSIEDFVPADQPAKLAAIGEVREALGPAFFDNQPLPAPNDAELGDAFGRLRGSAGAMAAITEQPEIAAAAARLGAGLDRFAERRGTAPDALRELGAALAGGVPAVIADFQQKLSVSEAVTIEDVPPELRNQWISGDGQVRLRVLPAEQVGSQENLERFAADVQAVAPQAQGVPATIAGAGQSIGTAFVQAIAYTTIAIALVIAFIRRRLSDVLLVLAPLAVAAIWTLAASALLDLPLNFANIIVVPLLIGLGVASSVHIVVRAREISDEHAGRESGSSEVLDTSTPLAVLVAQLNTVAAFATLAVSNHRGLYSMGLLLGISILFVLIVSLIVLPAFMIAISKRGQPPGAQAGGLA